MTWPERLRALSSKLFDEADEVELETIEFDEPERLETRWLGSPPATPDAIAAQEAALGVQLPDDYRGFLLASNGWRCLAGLPHGICSLLPVEEIGWMRDKDATTGRLQAYLEAPARSGVEPDEFVVPPEDYARTLLIGESDGNECILLLPPRSAADAWELWTYHPECGFTTGDTFDDLMASALEA